MLAPTKSTSGSREAARPSESQKPVVCDVPTGTFGKSRLAWPRYCAIRVHHLRVLVADEEARDVAARYRRLDELLVVFGDPVGVAVEQEETQQESQIGVLRDLAHVDGPAAVLRVIGPHLAKVRFRRGKVGGDQRHGRVRRAMQAVVRDAGRMERN